MYGFVPDIDEANSPPFSTVAMLKSVTCACPKQNINFIIAFIYLFNHFCIYYSQELFIITREKHLIIARFEFTKLSSSFFYPISRFFFFFFLPYPLPLDNDTNLINRQLVIVMYHLSYDANDVTCVIQFRESNITLLFTIGLFCGISMLPEYYTIHER